jgi:hypothetical protein
LNAANLLVSVSSPGAPSVHVVDLDGADLHDGAVPAARCKADVLRLCRSIDKWRATAGVPASVRGSFLREALGVGDAVDVLRQGRKAHRLRRWLGRTDRT